MKRLSHSPLFSSYSREALFREGRGGLELSPSWVRKKGVSLVGTKRFR